MRGAGDKSRVPCCWQNDTETREDLAKFLTVAVGGINVS